MLRTSHYIVLSINFYLLYKNPDYTDTLYRIHRDIVFSHILLKFIYTTYQYMFSHIG